MDKVSAGLGKWNSEMPRGLWVLVVIAVGVLVSLQGTRADGRGGGSWMTEFPVDKGELSPTGRNPYFILEPGYQLVLAGGADELTITVLNETRTVAGVETRVVEERETRNGRLIEVSRNYFAISTKTNGVYYFGEAVEIYRDNVVSHEGA